MLLDTTWRALPYYVTSILMASSFNTGLPLSIAFGHSENRNLYENHFNVFNNYFNVSLENFKFESDQGSSLKSLFLSKKIDYCICLRHFLNNLKMNYIAFGIRVIIKSCTQFEFDNSIKLYSKLFSSITNPSDIQLRDRLLRKAGLIFIQNKICIKDFQKWRKFSLLERTKIKLPSTTNSLESTHGQLNSKISRKRNFWQSLFDISENLNKKNQTIQQHIQHNFDFEKKKHMTV